MIENLRPVFKCEMLNMFYWKAVKPAEVSVPNGFSHSINAEDKLILLPPRMYNF